jgi:hypothetical protein
MPGLSALADEIRGSGQRLHRTPISWCMRCQCTSRPNPTTSRQFSISAIVLRLAEWEGVGEHLFSRRTHESPWLMVHLILRKARKSRSWRKRSASLMLISPNRGSRTNNPASQKRWSLSPLYQRPARNDGQDKTGGAQRVSPDGFERHARLAGDSAEHQRQKGRGWQSQNGPEPTHLERITAKRLAETLVRPRREAHVADRSRPNRQGKGDYIEVHAAGGENTKLRVEWLEHRAN